MANTIRVLFWLHKSKKNSQGAAPLMVRLTYQKQRVDKATGFYLEPLNWSHSKQKVKKTDSVSTEINHWMEVFRTKVLSLSRDSGDIHLPTLLDKLFAKTREEPTLLELFKEHNQRMKERVGNDYSYSTYEKYEFTYNKVAAFIKKKLNQQDVYLKDLKTSFIIDFDHYLRSIDHNQHNTAVKYCINLKKVINEAVMRGVIKVNPFSHYKTSYKDTPQVYLMQDEVNLLISIELRRETHILTRDLFLFQCYTGLAYTDLTTLSKKDFSIDNQGRLWIIKARQKSGIVSYIPLLPQAKEILEKYQDSIHRKIGPFPFYSIQKYNQYLGEIGDLAGFTKKLSSHVGRRTFGNIALAKGISINAISKILGHSNTLITQRIYAITTQNVIGNEVEKWR